MVNGHFFPPFESLAILTDDNLQCNTHSGLCHSSFFCITFDNKINESDKKIFKFSCLGGFYKLLYPAKQMFSGVYWNQTVCPSIRVSVCVQNTSFCQSAGGGIKSHLVTSLLSSVIITKMTESALMIRISNPFVLSRKLFLPQGKGKLLLQSYVWTWNGIFDCFMIGGLCVFACV